MCSSPKLFAACHVLRRLLMPRHPPCALFSLTSRSLNYAGTLLPLRNCTHSCNFHNFFAFCCLASSLCIIVQFSRCGSLVCQNQIPKFDQDRTPVSNFNMVGPSGLEPPTSRLSVVRSSQLSYGPILSRGIPAHPGGDKRNRTADPLLAKQVLSQLSYTPI